MWPFGGDSHVLSEIGLAAANHAKTLQALQEGNVTRQDIEHTLVSTISLRFGSVRTPRDGSDRYSPEFFRLSRDGLAGMARSQNCSAPCGRPSSSSTQSATCHHPLIDAARSGVGCAS